MTIEELKAENARLKAEVERLTFDPMSYWDEQGEWMPRHVHIAAVERLKAEVERLRDGVETMTYHAPGVETTAWVRAVEYDRLKAQVERLAKAGDAMADNCEAMTSSEHDCYDSDLMKFVRAWNAAKEGKSNA